MKWLMEKPRKRILTKPTRDVEYTLVFIGSLIGFFSSCLYFVLFEHIFFGNPTDLNSAIAGSFSGVIASFSAFMCLKLVDYQTRKFAICIAICAIWGLISVSYFYTIPALLLLSSTFLCFWRKNREIRIIK
ncbi:hypothetical protein [Pseudalkalibacillus salsuginis]|uniref:hypothetical protein n=1 Tax=Pseudalkalibacillus salsuginis TaxID=2910972 RepID=UPI001F369D1E|nr:hypothetical protein [Pseudalkalibacillus salsuginis]MCF6410369.1 hypothetical protein [Pseudalkalibacillus salsuginis]